LAHLNKRSSIDFLNVQINGNLEDPTHAIVKDRLATPTIHCFPDALFAAFCTNLWQQQRRDELPEQRKIPDIHAVILVTYRELFASINWQMHKCDLHVRTFTLLRTEYLMLAMNCFQTAKLSNGEE